MSNFSYTEEQLAVFNWVKKGSGNLCIRAFAGSAKSTTILHCIPHIPEKEQVLFVAFNKTIATEIGNKLQEMGISASKAYAKTLHATGRDLILQKFPISSLDEKKYYNIFTKLANETLEGLRERRTLPEYLMKYLEETFLSPWTLVKAVNFVRITLSQENVTVQNLQAIADHYNVTEIEEMFETWRCKRREWDLKNINPVQLACSLISEALEIGQNLKEFPFFDFTDMIYLPVFYKLKKRIPVDWVLVDECQDLNTCQAALVTTCLMNDNTRVIAVGDSRQAIMGFAGARNDSFDYLKQHLAASELTLSTCFRCPKKHIELAQRVVSEIKPYDKNDDGHVENIPMTKLLELAEKGHYIIARKTSTLIDVFFRLICLRKKAVVLGRDFGKSIINKIKKISKTTEIQKFISGLDAEFKEWVSGIGENEVELLKQYEDTYDCLAFLYREIEPTSYNNFIDQVCEIFSQGDDSESKAEAKTKIVLSVVHRVKGLEANDVYIVNDIPLVWAGQQAWQKEQEWNLHYVAVTRSKKNLYFINNDTVPAPVDAPVELLETENYNANANENSDIVDETNVVKTEDPLIIAKKLYEENYQEFKNKVGKFFVCNVLSGKYAVVEKAWVFLQEQIDLGVSTDALVTIKIER